MTSMFRLLRADEIDARVGTAKQGGKGVSLLLYKDARCDQNILDETVGAMNWQRAHTRDNANCIVSIWDEKKAQWISKEDTGTESKTEAEKGLASDSFKRACFNWGIGRELYSAPFIWIQGDPEKLKYERYTVLEIGYDENREINKLAIGDKSGKVVYKYGDVTMRYAPIKEEPLPEDAMRPDEHLKPHTWDARKAIQSYCEKRGIKPEEFGAMRRELINEKVVSEIKFDDMQPVDLAALCTAIEARYSVQRTTA